MPTLLDTLPTEAPALDQAVAIFRKSSVGVTAAMTLLFEAQEAKRTTKLALVSSLIGNDNPLTGKVHSLSSAETAAEQTPEYLAARQDVLAAEIAHFNALAQYDLAKLLLTAAVRG